MSSIRSLPLDAWRLARPYFWSEQRWPARGKLAATIALSLAQVAMTVVLSYWSRAFYNALQHKDWDSFIGLLLTWRKTEDGVMPGFVGLAAVYIAVAVFRTYLSQWLQISWRHWITTRMLKDWLEQRAYYGIGLQSASDPRITDNPDQRIAEDLKTYVTQTLALTLDLLSTIVNLFSYLFILWGLSGPLTVLGVSIPGYMVWVALIYAALGTVLVNAVGRPLIGLNFRQQRVEADFRFSLVRVRENAEAIALSAGETEERRRLDFQFRAIRDNWRAIMSRTKLLNTLTAGFNQISSIFPIVVAAPRYFAGLVELGDLTLTADAFGQVQSSMSWFVTSYAELATLRATLDRILSFQAEIATAQLSQQALSVAAAEGDEFALEHAQLRLPDGRILLEDGGMAVRRGQSVALSGRSGSGKSTLFRALAGIWPFGSGQVRPGAGTRMFLPQRPYFPIDSLREAVSYPAGVGAYPDDEIRAALSAVGLPGLAERLDQRDNWGQRLSGGEQQRLALARALLARPDWLFLDEATSSLDPATERMVLAALQERLPHTTFVAIVHRPEVAQLYHRRLVFTRDEAGPGRILDVT